MAKAAAFVCGRFPVCFVSTGNNFKNHSLTLYMQEENTRFAYSFLPGTLFVALLCLISLLSYLTEADLVWLGVFPRKFFGLVGVATSPLIHSGLVHLLSNAFPLILLSGFIIFQFKKSWLRIFTLVYVLSGVLTWFIGRQAYHIGASGIVYGLAGFLLFNGLLRRDRGSLAVSLAVLFLYGGLFYGLFPNEERISWEGHLGGLMAGLIATFATDDDTVRNKGENRQPGYGEQTQGYPHVSSTLGQSLHYTALNYTVKSSSERSKTHYQYALRQDKEKKYSITHSATPPSKA